MDKKDLIKQIKNYKTKGWEYSKGAGEINPYIICPSGGVYMVECLGHGCPLCDQFLEDNPSFEKILCEHSKDDKKEINDSKKFLSLIEKLERLKLKELHLFDE